MEQFGMCFAIAVIGGLTVVVVWVGIENWFRERHNWRDEVLASLHRIEKKKGGK